MWTISNGWSVSFKVKDLQRQDPPVQNERFWSKFGDMEKQPGYELSQCTQDLLYKLEAPCTAPNNLWITVSVDQQAGGSQWVTLTASWMQPQRRASVKTMIFSLTERFSTVEKGCTKGLYVKNWRAGLGINCCFWRGSSKGQVRVRRTLWPP